MFPVSPNANLLDFSPSSLTTSSPPNTFTVGIVVRGRIDVFRFIHIHMQRHLHCEDIESGNTNRTTRERKQI